MFGFLKFLFLCFLAVAAGVAAVAIPIDGKTGAEHVRALVEGAMAPAPAAPAQKKKPAADAPPRMARQRPSQPAADRPPADDPSEADRKALDALIGERVR